ncbi:ABC transporter permease [Ferrovibrio sp.]|uniref:ABC transporter permease n=1 Tax=Ferrovibrio sp. TaxID=1917215 RepID=UPI0035AE84E4
MADRLSAALPPALPPKNTLPPKVGGLKGFLQSDRSNIVLPALTFVLLLAIWEGSVVYFKVSDYIFPRIYPVLLELKAGYIDGYFWPHLAFTLRSVTIGYAIGCLLAIILGTLLSESRLFEKCLYPFIVALQSTPKVAMAPLIIVWCGYGILSKVVMVALICFFPLFVNTITGIKQADPALVNMMRAFAAPSWVIFFRVKLFAAAGHIFAGLQISIVLALIGAVTAEFVSSSTGLGWLVQAALANFNTAQMIAAILSLIAIGLSGTMLVKMLHVRIVFWDRASANTSAAK